MTKSMFKFQDQYLNQIRKERVHIIVTMLSGVKLEGYLKSFDSFCLLIENGSDILLYKHTISTVTSVGGTFRLAGERDLPASFSAEDKPVPSRRIRLPRDRRFY